MVSYLDSTGTQHLITKLLDTVYPVGSIYITTDDTSPASFLGGEWERYAQGRTLVGVAPTGKVADLHKYKDANGGNDPWMDTVWGGYDDSTIQKLFSKPDLYPGEARHSHWYGMKFGEYFGFTTLGTGGSVGAAVGLEVGNKKGPASDPNNRTVDGGNRLSRRVRTTVGNQVTSSAFHDIDAYEISQLTFASDSYPPFVTVYMWRRLG